MRYFMHYSCLAVAFFAPNFAIADEAEVFQRLDANTDGQISRDEVGEDQLRLFERLLRMSDENEDGQISKEEFVAGTTRKPDVADGPADAGPDRRSQFDVRQFLTRLDRNGDKKLSKEETPERMRENFERIDQNADGFIDADEFGRLAAAMRDRANANKRPQQKRNDDNRAAQMAAQIFKQRDANEDGKISIDEVPEERRDSFRRLLQQFDVDPSVGLTQEQFTKALGKLQAGGGRPAADKPRPQPQPNGNLQSVIQRLKQADANEDGKLSREEAPERMRQFFDRIDGNSDGFIDEAEIRHMLQRLGQE